MKRIAGLFILLFVAYANAADVVYQIHFQIPRHALAITSIDYRIDKISVFYLLKGREYHLADVVVANDLARYRDNMMIEATFTGIGANQYADIEVWAIAYNSKGAELDRTERAKGRVMNPAPLNGAQIKLTFQKLII